TPSASTPCHSPRRWPRHRSVTPGPIDRAVRTYLDHLSIEKGLAANTLSSYRRDLRRYREFLDQRAVGTLDEVTEATVTDFLVRLREGDQMHPPLGAAS